MPRLQTSVIDYGVLPMPTPQPIPEKRLTGRIVRFGVFELDLVAGELRKSGVRIRIQEQPFQVLALLLERPAIPLRCYLFSAAAFDYRRLGEKFQRLFLFILVLDQLWAVAPFLMAQKIGFGAAFAATAALLYVPFGERTLVRMAYAQGRVDRSAKFLVDE